MLLGYVNDSIIAGGWTKPMLAGPIKFLATYEVKVRTPPGVDASPRSLNRISVGGVPIGFLISEADPQTGAARKCVSS
jgi:hypothetical protein